MTRSSACCPNCGVGPGEQQTEQPIQNSRLKSERDGVALLTSEKQMVANMLFVAMASIKLISCIMSANQIQLHTNCPFLIITTMTTAPIIGRRQFIDGIVRPVFLDDSGEQYVILIWQCRPTCKL